MTDTTRKINIQEERSLSFPDPLMRAGLTLMKNVLTSATKNILLPLEVTTAVSAKDGTIQKKIYGSGMTALIQTKK